MDFIEGNRVLLAFVFILTLAVIFVVTIVGLTLLVKKITHRFRDDRQSRLHHFFSRKVNVIIHDQHEILTAHTSEFSSPLVDDLKQYLQDVAWGRKRGERQALQDVMVEEARNLVGESRKRLTQLFVELGFVDEEVRDLNSSRWWIRAKACRTISVMRPAIAIDPLILLLQDREPEVRMEAAMALVEIAGADALRPLLSHLKIITRWMSLQLSRAILGMGSEVVPDLIKGTESESASIKSFCVEMLGAIGDISAVEPLKVLMRSADDDLKCRALTAIGLLGDASGLPLILEYCRSDNEEVRKSAVSALGSLGAPEAVPLLAELLASDSVDVRLAAGESLSRLGTQGEIALRELAVASDELGRKLARQFHEFITPSASNASLTRSDSND
ncbi:MAG: HEAT repeat domain-containing protein [Bacteroidota bacterium]